MLSSILSLGALGAAFGCLLAYAGTQFAVEVDEKVEAIQGVLPGANCGACGRPGCAAMAAAIAKGEAPVNACPVGGTAVAAKISELMGTNVPVSADVKVACVMCSGGCSRRANYQGIPSCRAANLVGGGVESCAYGCLGYGDCVRVCPFDAISMTSDGVPFIDEEKCQNCGLCMKECIKQLIMTVPKAAAVHVNCSSQDTGVAVRKTNCNTGCIGCGICEKTCPFSAIKVIKDVSDEAWLKANPRKMRNIAVIDYSKCRSCGLCVSKCPTHALVIDEHKKHDKPIIGEGCIGCSICSKNCPVSAITGELKQIHQIDPDKCIACGLCVDKCPKKVISF